MVFGPKYYRINGIWAPKPYDLGPWALRDSNVTPISYSDVAACPFLRGHGFCLGKNSRAV